MRGSAVKMPSTSVKISQASALSAAASATAVVSDPPRPRVVMLPWSSIPWKPATTAISLRLRLSNSFSPSMLRMRALEKAESVRMRTWWPRKLRALPFSSWMARARSPTETCSPVETTTSCSRWLGRREIWPVSPSSRFVSPAIALTTTTTSFPALRAASARRATLRIRSRSPTEVPPYFWTISAMSEPARERQRAAARKRRGAQPQLGAALAARGRGIPRPLDEVQRDAGRDQRSPRDVQRGGAGGAERIRHQPAGQQAQPGAADQPRPETAAAAPISARARHRRQRKRRLLLGRLRRSEVDPERPVGIARARGPVAELVVDFDVVLEDVPRRGREVPAPLVLLTLDGLHVDRFLVGAARPESEEDLREDLALVGDLREHRRLLSLVAPRDGRVRDHRGTGVVGAGSRPAAEENDRGSRGGDGPHDPYQSTSSGQW